MLFLEANIVIQIPKYLYLYQYNVKYLFYSYLIVCGEIWVKKCVSEQIKTF